MHKIPTRLRGTNFCTSSECFAPSLVRKPSGPKWYETHQNMSLGSNGVNPVCSLRKIMTRLRGTNFSTSSARFAPSFERQRNGPKCIQIVQYTPKQEFGVQWGGSVVFVVKKSDATSWHELLHQFGPFCTVFCNATERSQMHQNKYEML